MLYWPPRAQALLWSVALAGCTSTETADELPRAPESGAAEPAVTAVEAKGPPVVAAVDPPVRAIGVGEHMSCALLELGEVRCWGAPRLVAIPLSSTPASTGLTEVVSLAVGTSHVCVARVDGSVWCWGRNSDGQLGDDTTLDRAAPTQVVGVTGIVEVVAGGHHTCARDASGGVWCWGHAGCVGHDASTPAPLPGRVVMPQAARLVAGDDVTCALLVDGPPRCWGFNTTGLLHPHLGPVLRAVASRPLARAVTLALGYRHACMTEADGLVYCMGDDQFGQLGDQRVPDDAVCDRNSPEGVRCTWTDPNSLSPAIDPELRRRLPPIPPRPRVIIKKAFPERQGLVAAAADRAVALAAGDGRTCSITRSGAVQCWGQWYFSGEWAHRTPRTIAGIEDAVAIAVARDHACALTRDRTVRCWGYNRSGELGTGARATTMVASPQATAVRW